MADLRDEIREGIREGRVTCIVGSGVSVAATYDPARTPNVASWPGLLEEGVARCEKLYPEFRKRAGVVRAEIASGDPDDLISAAEKVTRKLGGPGGGEFARWLRETVGALRIRHPQVPAALHALGIPLLTTNYDDILEEATGLPPITWRDAPQVEHVLRGQGGAILHLHGHWRQPESIILGIRSYDRIVSDKHAQAMQRALRTTRTLLFVGCGAGLEDLNVGALLQWSREVFGGSEYRHYRLVLDAEEEEVQKLHPPEERLFAVPYGLDHAALGPFLEALAPPAVKRSAATVLPVRSARSAVARAVPSPRVLLAGPFFGVPAGLRSDVEALWRNERGPHAAVRILEKLRRREVADRLVCVPRGSAARARSESARGAVGARGCPGERKSVAGCTDPDSRRDGGPHRERSRRLAGGALAGARATGSRRGRARRA
ncbi:SIR2 family NAD-dependent protein deacylase [Chondromyces apiculatus]|uniref:Uncharacterized protein n=1 Tax=Chondromyces apiculatus DSM 436 TaxID=1192034 RepID=A0A017T0A5_9BACT|nr:SIR2 family protein [Chondromyces apiculatus]EYF02638.1 Hypothetical protein CAP_6668 [Chondromyces apiculatus DSM 436]